MNKLKHFLLSKTAKTQMSTILLLAVIVGGGLYVVTQKPEWIPDLGFSTGGGGTADLIDVNKKLQFTWTAEFSGTVANAKTFYVYDENYALRETLATAATGIVASSQNYPSGTRLYVKYDDTSNQIWYDLSVPQMSNAEAQAQTYNDIALTYYAVGTYTSDIVMMNGLSVSDAETVNATGNATTTPQFSYQLTNTGADNTGLMESYDPVYGQSWGVWVTGTITGDNASLVTINGADYVFKIGNDWYFADKVSAQALCKWKVGLSYKPGYTGTDSCDFSLDLTAFTTAADTATLQLTFYESADPVYAMNHGGNYGANKVTLAEQTISIVGL